jgi:trans-aconitate methyltransferase
MVDGERQDHWNQVYRTKSENQVSWFEDVPRPSLDLMHHAGLTIRTSVVDIGGGASRLVDLLLDQGLSEVTVVDVSGAALAVTQSRLGAAASRVTWIAADVTTWRPARCYDIWHDRAAFHFLVEASDRAAYRRCLDEALKPGGYAIIATFAEDGPEKCSGLTVQRYSPESLAKELGEGFVPVESLRHEHATPWGAVQRFQFSLFRKA